MDRRFDTNPELEGLKTRPYWILKRLDIHNKEQLLKRINDDSNFPKTILALNNAGKGSIREIYAWAGLEYINKNVTWAIQILKQHGYKVEKI
jgi:hypothetical protein